MCARAAPHQLCFQCRRQAPIGQHRRKDPARKVAQSLERFAKLLSDFRQRSVSLCRVRFDQFLRNANIDRQRNELLLGAVMDISLESPSLAILGSHDPLPRSPQVEVQSHILKRRSGLRGKVQQEFLVCLRHRLTRGLCHRDFANRLALMQNRYRHGKTLGNSARGPGNRLIMATRYIDSHSTACRAHPEGSRFGHAWEHLIHRQRPCHPA